MKTNPYVTLLRKNIFNFFFFGGGVLKQLLDKRGPPKFTTFEGVVARWCKASRRRRVASRRSEA